MKGRAMTSTSFILWCAAVIGLVSCSPSGPPPAACVSMAPDTSAHQGSAQSSQVPYKLTFSKNTYTYSPNEQITVTLSGKNSEMFRGFFIQPRTNVDTLSIVGSFSDVVGGRTMQCTDPVAQTDMTAVCHSNHTDKNSISFTWTAPNENVGNISFVYTVVQVKSTYWVKAQADQPLMFQTDSGATQEVPQTTGGATNPPVTTQPLPDIVINWDPECGNTKGCFPTSNECNMNCEYLVKWKPIDNETVEFSLQRRATGDKWIAIGFSDDRAMGNDSVVECSSVGGSVAVHTSYNIVKNPGNNNVPLSVNTLGVSNVVATHVDGILSCKFRRKISAGLIATAAPDDATKFFDLNTPWYLMVAMGDMSGTTKRKHSTYPKISTAPKIDFLRVGADTSTPAPPGPAGEIVKPAACGTTEGCFHDCDATGKACTFYFGYKTNGDDTCMNLHCKQGSNRYCAIGFSTDQRMGDDYVIEAVAQGSNVQVFSSFNTGTSNERLQPSTFGLSQQSCSLADGVISCSFCRKTAYSSVSGRRKRAAVSTSNYFDLNNPYFLFYAYGSSAGVAIQQHDVTPVTTTQQANLQSTQELGAKAVSMATLVLIHAILMVAAWMFFAPVGIVMPTFYKPAWPQDTKLFGLAVWFTIHRAFMVMAFLCCAAAFVVIFVHVGGYADDICCSDFAKAHPIMGIVVMALALTNPIMALFRPHPGTKKRPIFNVAHLLVGISAYVVGIVNLFAGVEVAKDKLPDYMRIPMWVFCGWIGLFSIVLHLYQCATKKTADDGSVPILGTESNRGESYELKGPGSRDSSTGLTEKEVGKDSFKVAALYLHILVLLGLAVAVCVIMGLKSGGGEGGGDDSHEHD